MFEPQAITLDWWEGHFRLDNPDILYVKSDVPTNETTPFSIKHTSPSSGQEKITLPKTTLKRIRNGNEFYKDLYAIWTGGHKLGIMFANTRNDKQMPANDIQIKIENNRLYESDWIESLNNVATDLNAKFHNYTRLDIAVDGADYITARQKMQAGELKLMGVAAIADHYMHIKGKGRQLNGYYIGSSKSHKRIKTYNKTKELNRSNKSYIERYWKLNNLNTTVDILRTELTLRNDEIKKYPDIDLQKLQQPEHLASIMKSAMQKFGEFRIQTTARNVSRMPKYEIIDWEHLGGKTLPKNSTVASTEIWSAKNTMKYLFQVHLTSGDQQFFDVAYEIAINTNLVQWYTKQQPYWIKDYELRARSVGGELDRLPWKYHFKRYTAGEQVIMHVA